MVLISKELAPYQIMVYQDTNVLNVATLSSQMICDIQQSAL